MNRYFKCVYYWNLKHSTHNGRSFFECISSSRGTEEYDAFDGFWWMRDYIL